MLQYKCGKKITTPDTNNTAKTLFITPYLRPKKVETFPHQKQWHETSGKRLT